MESKGNLKESPLESNENLKEFPLESKGNQRNSLWNLREIHRNSLWNLMTAGCWLLAAGCWLLAAGCCSKWIPFNSNQFPKGFPLDFLSISLSRVRTSRRSTEPPLPYHFTSTLLAAGCWLLDAGCCFKLSSFRFPFNSNQFLM